MKLKRENKNPRPRVRNNTARIHAARLNRMVVVVALLWLVTSALMIFFYRTGSAPAEQPGDSRQFALQLSDAANLSVPQAAATANCHFPFTNC